MSLMLLVACDVRLTPGHSFQGPAFAYLDPRLGDEMLVCGLHRQLQAVAPAPGFAGVDQQLLCQVFVIAVALSEQLCVVTGKRAGLSWWTWNPACLAPIKP